jgi:hypothetical protein
VGHLWGEPIFYVIFLIGFKPGLFGFEEWFEKAPAVPKDSPKSWVELLSSLIPYLPSDWCVQQFGDRERM